MRIPTRILAPVLVMGVVIPTFVFVMMSAGPMKTEPIKGREVTHRNIIMSQEGENPDDNSLLHDSPSKWQKHIRHQCQRLGMASTISGENFNRNVFKQILVDDKNKLVYCQIPKVATTTWRRILLILTGKLNTTDLMSLSPDDVHHKYDVHLTYLSDLSHEEIVHRLKNYYKFLFVREPLERLLSAFRNKFVTHTKSAIYFRKVFGRKIAQYYRADKTSNARLDKMDPEKINLKFEEFIAYLTDTNRKIMMNEHWERFHKLCHPCLINYDFIGKLESIDRDSSFLLEKNGLSHLIKFPTRKESKYSNHKTDDFMTEYYSKIPKESLHKLLKEYEADFSIFNYTVPEVMKSLL